MIGAFGWKARSLVAVVLAFTASCSHDDSKVREQVDAAATDGDGADARVEAGDSAGSDAGAAGSGGASGSGGAFGSGGASGSGGAFGSGGNLGSGGALGSGGVVGSGGNGSGGSGSGGAPGSGGSLGSGGAPGSGGSGSGGAAGCDLTKPFSAPVLVEGVNSSYQEMNAAVSPDELTIYVSSSRPGGPGGYDIYRATRATRAAAFSTPVLLAGINSKSNELGLSISSDGLSLYFISTRPSGNFDAWVATRTSVVADFGAEVLVPNIGSSFRGIFLTSDGLTLYLNAYSGGANDIYRSTRASITQPFGVAARVTELNTTSEDDSPVQSADGLTIYFSSGRAGGAGGSDIWMARRTTAQGQFGAPTVVTELNTTAEDSPVAISPDGCRLYIASSRSGGLGSSDIWVASKP